MVIISGSHSGSAGTVESVVFQQSVDYPDDYAAGYHVVLADGGTITVRWDKLRVL